MAGLRALAAEEAERISINAGQKGLLVHAHRNGHVIVPINARDPLKPDLYSQGLDVLGVDVVVRGAYVVALRRLPRERTIETVEAVAAFLL